METLLKKQTVQAQHIKNVMLNFDKMGREKHTRGTIESRQKLLERYWGRFQIQQLQLLDLADDLKQATHEYFTTFRCRPSNCLFSQTLIEIGNSFATCSRR